MNSRWTLTQESWDRLLGWLDASPDEAAQKYEAIRRRLVTLFSCRGSSTPEELADETMDRVARAISQPDFHYVGNPAPFFYGVAKNIFLESLRRKPRMLEPQECSPTAEEEREHICLERCLDRLPGDSRSLILDYYRWEKAAKIDFRKRLAERLGVGVNALRIQIHRTRLRLRACVQACLQSGEAA